MIDAAAQRPTRLLALALVWLFFSQGSPAWSDDRAEYEARIQELQRNIQKLQSSLEEAEGSRDQLREQLEASESEIGELLQNIERIEKKLEKQETDLQSLKSERRQLQIARAEQQDAVARQVRAAYQLGRQSQIKLLLNQESPQRVDRLLRYYDYWLEARADKINRYLETLQQLDQLEPKIQERTQQLAQSRKGLKSRHEQLREQQQTRRQTLAKLNQRIRNTDQELGELRRDRARLESLLEEMVSSLAELALPGDGEAFSERKGRIPWPVRGPVRHAFGSPQLQGQVPRNGLVIAASAGDPVVAVHHGRVVFSDYLRGHGLLLIIDHGEGYMSLYAHNQVLYQETGEWVAPGETIARVGASGGQERTGLYFEIRHKGQPLDPSPWLAQV